MPLRHNRPAFLRVRPAALLLPLAAALHAGGVLAQTVAGPDQGASSPVFQLGQVDVQAAALSAPPPGGTSSSVVTQQQMLDRGALNVGEALSDLPGVTPVTLGQRGETQVNIRGFDSRQITLNIDGIPIYVPYDGNVDLSRLLVPGISEIVVTKGLGSLMYGPNNMGGLDQHRHAGAHQKARRQHHRRTHRESAQALRQRPIGAARQSH